MRTATMLSANALVIAVTGICCHLHNPKNVGTYAACSFAAIALVAVAVHLATRPTVKANRRILTKWK